MDRVERLLSAGYFPSQLPPPFKTERLAVGYAGFYAAWLSLQPKQKKGVLVPKAPSSKPELFSVPRAGHQRRMTSITNPIAQTYLSVQIGANWPQVVKHFRRSRISASHPRFLRFGVRGANVPPMQHLYERKVLKAAGYRYMLRSDISKFFPTLYTHSIPWALHSKAVAKKNKQPTLKFFGNLLDLASRQCQEEQTFGIPIGPDTSHIIAEIVATAIDVELKRRLKQWPAGFRYVDDYFLFFPSARAADECLAALVRSLKEFELQVNFDKTAVSSVIEITDDYWTHQLKSADISGSGRKQASAINHFFELAKELARKSPGESVMTYALKRASSELIRKENWPIFEAHLMHAALAYPNSLQTTARFLGTYAGVGYKLNEERITRLVDAVIQEHAPLGHHAEVAWCLWIVKQLSLNLSVASMEAVSEIHSSVCALLLLDLDVSGQLSKSPRLSYWKQFETSASLHEDMWLLSYEAGVRGWGGFSDAHIKADKHFSVLASAGVRFYDAAVKPMPFFRVSSEAYERAQQEDVADVFEFQDIDELLEFEDEDYDGYGGIPVKDGDDAELPV